MAAVFASATYWRNIDLIFWKKKIALFLCVLNTNNQQKTFLRHRWIDPSAQMFST